MKKIQKIFQIVLVELREVVAGKDSLKARIVINLILKISILFQISFQVLHIKNQQLLQKKEVQQDLKRNKIKIIKMKK